MTLVAAAATAQHGASADRWPSVGGDLGFTKYSPLEQIDAANVGELEVVWEAEVPDAPILAAHPNLRSTNFEATPLLIDGVLFAVSPLSIAFAVDPATGRRLWEWDPQSYDTEWRGSGLTFLNRGMAYWSDGERERLFFASGDARLFALDPRSGGRVTGFGEGGVVDTRRGIPRITSDREYSFGSAPIVCGDVVVVGSRVADRPSRLSQPPGWVRGYDVRSGEQRWTFHTIPLEHEPGAETWSAESRERTGAANVWTLFSADPEAGLVFLPVSTATNDFYGGGRLGDNLYAESLVALDCATGRRVWHFQVVHHGLWDYDLPTAPTLADITVEGREIKALAQPTKHGFLFVLDRLTGEPVWPVEERPVPQSTIPGERSSPTQPFPTRPEPFERQGVGEDDLIDFTPELRAEAVEILGRYRGGPLFTPPSLEGTLQLPGYGGGANWPGAGLDPESRVLFVPSMTQPQLLQLIEPDPARSEHRYVARGGRVEGPRGLPLIKPPYARLTAIDLDTGETLWQIPNGGPGPIDHPALAGLELTDLGSHARAAVLVTGSLLLATEGSGRTGSAVDGGTGLRAIDKTTGELIARIELGDEPTGMPMTYLHEGRQYVVVAVGSTPPKLVALTADR